MATATVFRSREVGQVHTSRFRYEIGGKRSLIHSLGSEVSKFFFIKQRKLHAINSHRGIYISVKIRRFLHNGHFLNDSLKVAPKSSLFNMTTAL